MDEHPSSRSWFERLSRLFQVDPKDRTDIVDTLKSAQQNSLINTDVFSMLEGVLQVAEMQVRDIMIPRPQMVVIEHDMPLEQIVKTVIDSAHSRFPVIGDNRDDIEGTLLAKDLLQVMLDKINGGSTKFIIKELLRPAVIIPESKRLDVLLKDFRVNRNHMAIVVDEYGAVSGLVTIEDVLEQIVGEIEDEHDFADEEDFIKPHPDNEFVIKAQTEIAEFNQYFGSTLSDNDFDTIGGLVTQAFGHVPAKGEQVKIDHFQFTVLSADTRRIKLLRMKKEEVIEPVDE